MTLTPIEHLIRKDARSWVASNRAWDKHGQDLVYDLLSYLRESTIRLSTCIASKAEALESEFQ